MNTTEKEIWCDQWLAAWSGNQPEELLKYYADDAFYRDPYLNQGVRGKDTIGKYFARLLAANPNWIWTREELWPNDKGFTLKWKAQIPLPSGETLVEYGMDVVELSGKKITRNEVYFDRVEWLKGMK